MTNSLNWSKIIDLAQLKKALTCAEIAPIVGCTPKLIIGWRDYKGRLVVSISGKGGRFVSYWKLNRAIELLVEAIKNCWDAAKQLKLQKWIETAWKRGKISLAAKELFEQALQEQQKRLADWVDIQLKADSFVNLIVNCQDHQSLNLVGQLFSRQQFYFEHHPTLVAKIIATGQQQRAYLHSLEQPLFYRVKEVVI